MMIDDDDNSEESLRPYEQGHWIWDDYENKLIFKSDFPEDEDGVFILPPKVDIAKLEFNDDIDLFEQQRFKRRYQRKSSLINDVILLQDIVDVVIYTAPQELLSSNIIKILHLSMTEMFLRSLIIYCQYYLQVDSELERRLIESESRIPTTFSHEIENELQENLAEFRLLVAKEYTTMLLGEGAMKDVHHMGPTKSHASMSQKEIRIFDVLMKITTQIVWVALGRKFYNKIEIEVNRLFRSETYNCVKHKLNTKYLSEMTPEQRRRILFGDKSMCRYKLLQHSPLLNELSSKDHTDYQQLGLGKIKYPTTGKGRLSSRLMYMERALVAPERSLRDMKVSVGILGLPRSRFDIMLREIVFKSLSKGSGTSSSSFTRSKLPRSQSSLSSKSQQSSQPCPRNIYGRVNLPPKSTQDNNEMASLPESFPQKKLVHAHNACAHEQCEKWLSRVARFRKRQRLGGSFSNRRR